MVFDKTLPIGGRGLPTGVLDAQARLVFLRSHTDHQVLGQARHGAGRAAARGHGGRAERRGGCHGGGGEHLAFGTKQTPRERATGVSPGGGPGCA